MGLFLFGCVTLFLLTYKQFHISGTTPVFFAGFTLNVLGSLALLLKFFLLPPRRSIIRKDLLIGYLGIYLLIYISSLTNSILKASYLNTAISVMALEFVSFTFLSLLLVTYSIAPSSFLKNLCRFITLLAVLSSFFAIILFFLGNLTIGPFSFGAAGYLRLIGWYGNPNYLAGIIGIGAIASSYLHKQTDTHYRTVYFIIFIIMLGTLIWTGSKGSFFAFILAYSITYFWKIPLWLKTGISLRLTRIVFLMATLIFLIVILLVWLNPEKISDFFNVTLRLNTLTSDNPRLAIWAKMIPALDQSNFFQIFMGHGNGYYTAGLGTQPHNAYARFIIDYGILFFSYYVLFLFFILFTFSQDKRLKAEERIVCLSFLVFVYISNISNAKSFSGFYIENFIFNAMVVLACFGKPSPEKMNEDL